MAYRSGERRASGINPALVLKFIATSFVYLLAGLLLFLLDILGILIKNRDSVFVLWLFGFVAMIIFGLSYMFSSGLARSSARINATVNVEYVLLNMGVILFFSGFSGIISVQFGKPLAITGLIAIIIAVILHLANLIMVSMPKGGTHTERRSFEDEY
ncbi:MAG: hypothetical protein ACYCT2_04020 [Thermoplasmataceae archaeon]